MNKILLLCSMMIFAVIGCKQAGPVLSSDNQIKELRLTGVDTKISNDTIYIYVPANASTLRFVFETLGVDLKAKVSQPQIKEGDTWEVGQLKTIEIEAEDGSVRTYKVELVYLNGIKKVSLEFRDRHNGAYNRNYRCNGIVDDTKKAIIFDLDYTRFKDCKVYLNIELNGYETSLPKTDDLLKYEVETQLYDTLLLFNKNYDIADRYSLVFRNDDARITNIELPFKSFNSKFVRAATAVKEYTEGLTDNDIIYFVFEGEDVSNVKPTVLTYSDYATANINADKSINFNNIVDFEVTSQSGKKVTTKVKVVKRKIIITNDHDRRPISQGFPINATYWNFTYRAISPVKQVWLRHSQSNVEYPTSEVRCSVAPDNDRVSFKVDPNMPQGRYFLRVELENGDIISTNGTCAKG